MIDASGGVLDQDYEMFEQQTPHFLLQHEYLTDSAGAGQWRGGLGVETTIRIDGDQMTCITFGDGDEEPAFGLYGGKEGTLNKIEFQYPDGTSYRPKSKELIPGVAKGTHWIQEAGGGGGYGDPYLRPATKVQKDVKNGVVSVEKAREDYGVIIDPKTLTLDQEATHKLRSKPAGGIDGEGSKEVE
jgi:N-methylhydantoinase B